MLFFPSETSSGCTFFPASGDNGGMLAENARRGWYIFIFPLWRSSLFPRKWRAPTQLSPPFSEYLVLNWVANSPCRLDGNCSRGSSRLYPRWAACNHSEVLLSLSSFFCRYLVPLFFFRRIHPPVSLAHKADPAICSGRCALSPVRCRYYTPLSWDGKCTTKWAPALRAILSLFRMP